MRASAPPGLIWIAGYLAVTLAVVAAAGLRRRPVLVKGSSFLTLTVLFVVLSAIAAVDPARRQVVIPLPLVAFQAVALVAAWAARGRWLVMGADAAAVGTTVERCLGMLCAAFERAGDAYVVPLADGPLRVTVRRAPTSATVLTFRGATGHRKAALLRTLLAKQFEPVVPRVRVGTRGEE